ncbi:hypothetical protein WMY93_029627 [Mugilogobius chulae]|uniref:Ig-like domain-containing protein n=1 Tax=Mugilogobius chulae TaxID=88201 RepID=A0AAW0MXJ8_9GOBI
MMLRQFHRYNSRWRKWVSIRTSQNREKMCLLLCEEQLTQVSCAVGTKCLLPCVFSVGSNAAVHWRKSPGEARVHSFYNNQDQLQNQHQDYRGRTFVFQSQIHRGNASLQLSEVKVQDEGSYLCFTSSNTDCSVSTVYLKVFVDIDEVDLVKEGSQLVCSSKGIYPEPQINWSVFSEIKTSVQQREDQLYDINSSITLPSDVLVHQTSCSVSTAHSLRTALIMEECE